MPRWFRTPRSQAARRVSVQPLGVWLLPRPRRALAGLAVVAAMLTPACATRPPDDAASYARKLAAERELKDDVLRSSSDSPIPADRRAELLPLPYYPPDESFAVPAALTPGDPREQPTVEMPTSTGKRRLMRRVGVLDFTLKGERVRLSAFVEASSPDMNRLFVPFTDLTTGTETYEAGRYLDLDRTVTGIYAIDFNRAYNPYCAYNPTYDCPFPPPENRLKVAIRAGERLRVGSPRGTLSSDPASRGLASGPNLL